MHPRRLVSGIASAATREVRQRRIALWEELRRRAPPAIPTTTTTTKKTPLEILAESGNTLTKKALKQFVVAEHVPTKRLIELNAREIDPREGGARAEDVRLLTFEDPRGRRVFWHSSAHLLGSALEEVVGIERMHLRDGPPVKEVVTRRRREESSGGESTAAPGQGGFFYEFSIPERKTASSREPVYSLTQEDIEKMEKFINDTLLSRGKPPLAFERLDFPSVDFAREMFKDNPEKMKLIEELSSKRAGGDDDVRLSAYRLGDFIDLCRGPHLGTVSHIGYVKLLRSSGAGERVHRIHGISFRDVKDYEKWEEETEALKNNDHRVMGVRQKLFSFNPEMAPGGVFFHPLGAQIFVKLMEMLREEYAKRGINEVITPQLYDEKLFERSGHLDHYASDMFFVEGGGESAGESAGYSSGPTSKRRLAMKPMNCPGHCLLFLSHVHHSTKPITDKDLPIRYADFSPLHRNERSGALSGLTRVTRFHQDDAHVFCTMEQLEREILANIDLIKHVYSTLFGFDVKFKLSTRPEEGFVGEIQEWDEAEKILRTIFRTGGLVDKDEAVEEKRGDGAFYGPKIDVEVLDNLGRYHQCGTIQLDFQLPKRFGLSYDVSSDSGSKRTPVMIHRAVLGSFERFIALVLENYRSGRLPFWLSPRQVKIILVAHPPHDDDDDDGGVQAVVADTVVNATPTSSDSSSTTAGSSSLQRERHERQVKCARKVKEALLARGRLTNVDTDFDCRDTLKRQIRDAQLAPYNCILVIGDNEATTDSVSARSGHDGSLKTFDHLEDFVRACAEAVRRRDNVICPW